MSTETVTPTLEEARAILEAAVRIAGGPTFESSDTGMQVRALGGVVNIVQALQAIGWRVSRPLVAVPGGQE